MRPTIYGDRKITESEYIKKINKRIEKMTIENGEKGTIDDKLLLEKYNANFNKEKFVGNNGHCETCKERSICLDFKKEYKWCVKEKKWEDK